MHGSLFCSIFYVIWSHFRSVWVSTLFEFICHLISLPFCMGLYFVRVSMSFGLTSVLYGSLFYSSFYVTLAHFRSVWVSILFEFLFHLNSHPFCIGLCVVRVSMSLPLTYMYFLYRTPILYKKRFFFTINFISPLSSYAKITNVLFFFKTMRNDHFLSGKQLK